MKDELDHVLEVERAIGEQYGRAYDSLVKPFIEKKQAELFEAFQQMSTTEQDGLLTIKLQCNALQSLDDEFKHYISTGQLAKQQLTDKEKH